jgi:molecular chaperone DnaJ
MTKEYYEILGVSEDASQDKIKQAYRKKAKKYHPDANSEHADEEKFKEINKAYEVLSDPEKREKYDQFGKAGVEGEARGEAGFGGFADLFKDLFGGFGGGRSRNKQGKHLKIPITVSLEDAYDGIEKTFDVERRQQCSMCTGSGAKNGETATCSKCHGRGRVQQVQRTPFGRARTLSECDHCNGRGEVPQTPCPDCEGDGVVLESDTVSIDIPAGVQTGQRLRIRGKGHETRDGRAGDLYAFIDVAEHAELERRDDDLFTTVRVGVGDAVLGGSVEIETPDTTISVDIPAGTQPGQVLRVEGKGMPKQGRGDRYGDLYVEVDVQIPEDVREEQRAVFEELKETPEKEKRFFETVKDIIGG